MKPRKKPSWFKVTELEDRIVLAAPGGGGSTGGDGGIAIIPVPDQTISENAQFTFDVETVFTTAPVFSLDQASLDRGMTINPSTGIIQWVASETDGEMPFNVTVTVNDGSLNASDTFLLDVNQAPLLAIDTSVSVDDSNGLKIYGSRLGGAQGELVFFAVKAEDMDIHLDGGRDQLSATVAGPSGAQLDQLGENLWIVSWEIPTNAAAVTPISLIVSDGIDSTTFATEFRLAGNVSGLEIGISPIIYLDFSILNVTAGGLIDVTFPALSLSGLPISYSLDPASRDLGLTIDSNGNLSGDIDQPGTYNVTVTVDDGIISSSRTFDLVVAPNAAPTIDTIDTQQAAEGQLFSLQVGVTDPDSNSFAYSLDQPSIDRGLQISSSGLITWTPGELDGGKQFNVTVSVDDGQNSVDGSFLIDVQEVNQAPTVFIDTSFVVTDSDGFVYNGARLGGLPGEVVFFAVKVDDADIDSDGGRDQLTTPVVTGPLGTELIYDQVSDRWIVSWKIPTDGTAAAITPISLEVSDGSLSTTFAREIRLAAGGGTVGSVITFLPIFPTITTGSLSLVSGGFMPLPLAALSLDQRPLTYSLDEASRDLGFSIDSNGNLSGDIDQSGTYSVTVTANDGLLSSSKTFDIIVVVIDQNDAPVFLSSLNDLEIDENVPFELQVSAVDLDNDTLTYSLDQASLDRGLLIDNTGLITWANHPNEIDGGASFDVTVTISDNFNPPVSDTFHLTVIEDIQAPVAGNDAESLLEGAFVDINLLANDSDADIPENNLGVIIVDAPQFGSLMSLGNGLFRYTHNGSENFSDSFTYKLSDGLADSNIATVDLSITPVNDAPEAANDMALVDEGGAIPIDVLGNDSDAENNNLQVIIVDGAQHGSLLLNADGTVTYQHDGSETTADFFTYKLSEGDKESAVARVDIAINPVNDAPQAANDLAFVDEGGAIPINILGNDSDAENNNLQVILVNGAQHGSLLLNADGTVTYQHDGSETTADFFTYKLSDGDKESAVARVDIAITPLNDAPVAQGDAASLLEGGSIQLNLLANDNDSDLPGDDLQIIILSGPLHGTLLLNADKTVTYQHDGSENFSDSLTYQINDGHVLSDSATVSLQIDPVNDNLPVAVGESYLINIGGQVSENLLANDSDADMPNDQLHAELNIGPLHGTLLLNADGTFTYQHDGSNNLSDSFSYKVVDAAGNFSIATVDLTIQPGSLTPLVEFMGGDNKVYIENQAAKLIAPAVMVSDEDSLDFAGGFLKISVSANGEASDRLIIKENGAVDIRSGNTLYLRGELIGTFSGGDGLNPLLIHLNANADAIAVARIISRIGFYNISDAPSTLTREISFELNDGDGGLNAVAVRHMRVISANDAPEIMSAAEFDRVARGSWDDIGMDLGLQIIDPDALDSEMMEVSLKVSKGILTFSDVSDLTTVVFGRKVNLDGSKQITFTASLEEANVLLSRLMYKVTDLRATSDTLWIRVNDLGNDGMLCGQQKDWKAFALKIV